jgi:hypothetical protein
MPPQQHDRLLDLVDDVLGFRAHDAFLRGLKAALDSYPDRIKYEMTGAIRQEQCHPDQ